MDLALYVDVLRRHRAVVVVGVALTVVLALLTYVRVSPSGISYRSPEIWSNQATLLLTQEGAPELRSVLSPDARESAGSLADTDRFLGLVNVYAAIATSDAVIDRLQRRGRLTAEDVKDGELPIAARGVDPNSPTIVISASSVSGTAATNLTLAATKAFLDVVRTRQIAAKIPAKDRIVVRVVNSAGPPQLVGPRSKAMPILVLLAGLIATVAFAFMRDNLARRRAAPELTTLTYPDASADVTQPLPTRRPVARPDSPTTARDTGRVLDVNRDRPTLGSVPAADSPKVSGRWRSLPDDEARRQAGGD